MSAQVLGRRPHHGRRPGVLGVKVVRERHVAKVGRRHLDGESWSALEGRRAHRCIGRSGAIGRREEGGEGLGSILVDIAPRPTSSQRGGRGTAQAGKLLFSHAEEVAHNLATLDLVRHAEQLAHKEVEVGLALDGGGARNEEVELPG